MVVKVGELQAIQDNIRQYRSWYDGSFKNLSILRQLSLAFPEDGSVTAKNIEVRDGGTVTCSGTARDYAALLAMQAKLRTADGVRDVKLEQIRGKAPMQFVFGFNFNNGGGSEN
jgi:Tfp pilus assembly protein PilN